MKTFATAFFALWAGYTAWCCAYGPPYHDAYGEIVRAAYCMDYAATRGSDHYVSTCR